MRLVAWFHRVRSAWSSAGFAAALLLPPRCDSPSLHERAGRVLARTPLASAPLPLDFVHIEALDPNERPPMFVMRGGPRGAGRLVFLHGMCGHALGYAQAFQFSAAKHGTLIAPQGDVSCGGPWSKWSSNLDALDARIEAAFKKLGQEGPLDDITVLGYSQGAMRAEALARKWPQRYTRLVLMGGPIVPSPRGLTSLRAVVTMAGSRDRQDLMRRGAAAFAAAGIPATYHVIPEATHGAMGPNPEATMGEAIEWLYTHSRAAPPAPSVMPARTAPSG
jgi:pimeloyl-ACP methyl ester carboxylesterase